MSRKNFTVATTEDGKTTLTKIDKTPTGKVKTMKKKEELQKAREEQYKNFRINALKRRAKRMGLNDEQTAAKVEELKKQMAASNDYNILIMFNPNDFNLVKQALMNDDIAWKLLVTSYGFIDGDDELLADLRKLLPPSAKIYPYVKRKPPILPSQQPSGRGKKTRTKAEKKNLAAAAKKARKAATRIKGRNTNDVNVENSRKGLSCFRKRANIARMSKEDKKAFMEKVKAIRESWPKKKAGVFAGKTAAEKKKIKAEMKAYRNYVKASTKANKKQGGTTVSLVNKKPSESLKRASRSVKQAA